MLGVVTTFLIRRSNSQTKLSQRKMGEEMEKARLTLQGRLIVVAASSSQGVLNRNLPPQLKQRNTESECNFLRANYYIHSLAFPCYPGPSNSAPIGLVDQGDQSVRIALSHTTVVNMSESIVQLLLYVCTYYLYNLRDNISTLFTTRSQPRLLRENSIHTYYY